MGAMYHSGSYKGQYMAKAKQHKRPNGYIHKWEQILSSPAYRDLKPAARCLLEEFQRIYRPGRNGKLSISTKRAAELINISEPTASKAFYELVEHGFLVLTEGHLWQERRAREWRLTFELGANNREPTDEWMDWKPKKTPTQKTGAELLKKQGQAA